MHTATPTSANVEKISAMLDGELTENEFEIVLRSLNVATLDGTQTGERETWDMYNQIGDVLRSDDLALKFSADFSTRLSQRLEAEPVVLAPRAVKSDVLDDLPMQTNANVAPMRAMRPSRSWAFAGVAAAALLTVVAVPQLSPFFKGDRAISNQMAQTSHPADANSLTLVNGDATSASGASIPRLPGQIQVLRDPRLDSYLMAHQKFSPAIGSGSRYVSDVSDVVNAAASAPASVSTENK